MLTQPTPSFIPPWSKSDTLALFVLLTIAVVLRAVFFTGFFGSDEATYASVASEIAHGEWRTHYYVGSNRYGVNLPSAAFLTVFGMHEWAASLWAFLTSVGEVGLVYWGAHRLAGRNTAIAAALLLSTTPLHIHLAGRLMADPPLAFFITLSFALLLMAELRQKTFLYFSAGLSAGFVFWIKEVVLIYIVILGLAAFLFRPWKNVRLMIIAGLAAAGMANLIFMYVISGDSLHSLHVLLPRSSAQLVRAEGMETGAAYYLRYLLLDMRHTGLLGPLALCGMVFWFMHYKKPAVADKGIAYAVVWGLGLMVLFSLFVISFTPLTLITKQTNYMTIFMAPLAILGGYLVTQMRPAYRYAVLGSAATFGIFFGAMEQMAIHTFTANSKAAVIFASERPAVPVYGSVNSERAFNYYAMFSPNKISFIRPIAGLSAADLAPKEGGIAAYAIWDRQTEDWSFSPLRNQKDIPACWLPIGKLQPADMGLTNRIFLHLLDLLELLPANLMAPVKIKLSGLVHPKPAFIFAIPSGCQFKLAAKQ